MSDDWMDLEVNYKALDSVSRVVSIDEIGPNTDLIGHMLWNTMVKFSKRACDLRNFYNGVRKTSLTSTWVLRKLRGHCVKPPYSGPAECDQNVRIPMVCS
jgi:hypothetical protein